MLINRYIKDIYEKKVENESRERERERERERDSICLEIDIFSSASRITVSLNWGRSV